MSKFIDAFFRHKLLLLLPPFLVMVVVTPFALLTAPILYESKASIWVDRPSYLSSTDNWNQYISPAQNQTARLTELLKTDSFVVDVFKRTSLAPLTASSRGLDRLQLTLGQGLAISSIGTHLVVVSFKGDSPQTAYQVLGAIIDAFNDRVANDQVNQSSLATSFYTDQLQQAQDELTKSSDALRRYIQANASLSEAGPGISTNALAQLASMDPRLAELQSQVQSQQERVTSARQALQQSEFQASASVDGAQLAFQLVDAPVVPSVGSRNVKARIMYPIGGLVGSLALSGLMLVLFAAADRSVHSEGDLVARVRVLGEVPYIRLRRVPRGLNQVAARRAVGFVAGAALPAPKGAK